MFIDIDKLPKEGLKVSKEFEFLSVDLVEEDAVLLEPVRAEVTLRKVGDEIFIKGRLTARLSFTCGRCLSPYEYPVDSRFDLVYLPEEMDLVKEELDEDDINRMFYDNRQVDLQAVVLEQLNLTFPPKPLCSPNCEGICAVCGKLRRHGRCDFADKVSEAPVQKLKIQIRDKK